MSDPADAKSQQPAKKAPTPTIDESEREFNAVMTQSHDLAAKRSSKEYLPKTEDFDKKPLKKLIDSFVGGLDIDAKALGIKDQEAQEAKQKIETACTEMTTALSDKHKELYRTPTPDNPRKAFNKNEWIAEFNKVSDVVNNQFNSLIAKAAAPDKAEAKKALEERKAKILEDFKAVQDKGFQDAMAKDVESLKEQKRSAASLYYAKEENDKRLNYKPYETKEEKDKHAELKAKKEKSKTPEQEFKEMFIPVDNPDFYEESADPEKRCPGLQIESADPDLFLRQLKKYQGLMHESKDKKIVLKSKSYDCVFFYDAKGLRPSDAGKNSENYKGVIEALILAGAKAFKVDMTPKDFKVATDVKRYAEIIKIAHGYEKAIRIDPEIVFRLREIQADKKLSHMHGEIKKLLDYLDGRDAQLRAKNELEKEYKPTLDAINASAAELKKLSDERAKLTNAVTTAVNDDTGLKAVKEKMEAAKAGAPGAPSLASNTIGQDQDRYNKEKATVEYRAVLDHFAEIPKDKDLAKLEAKAAKEALGKIETKIKDVETRLTSSGEHLKVLHGKIEGLQSFLDRASETPKAVDIAQHLLQALKELHGQLESEATDLVKKAEALERAANDIPVPAAEKASALKSADGVANSARKFVDDVGVQKGKLAGREEDVENAKTIAPQGEQERQEAKSSWFRR